MKPQHRPNSFLLYSGLCPSVIWSSHCRFVMLDQRTWDTSSCNGWSSTIRSWNMISLSFQRFLVNETRVKEPLTWQATTHKRKEGRLWLHDRGSYSSCLWSAILWCIISRMKSSIILWCGWCYKRRMNVGSLFSFLFFMSRHSTLDWTIIRLWSTVLLLLWVDHSLHDTTSRIKDMKNKIRDEMRHARSGTTKKMNRARAHVNPASTFSWIVSLLMVDAEINVVWDLIQEEEGESRILYLPLPWWIRWSLCFQEAIFHATEKCPWKIECFLEDLFLGSQWLF